MKIWFKSILEIQLKLHTIESIQTTNSTHLFCCSTSFSKWFGGLPYFTSYQSVNREKLDNTDFLLVQNLLKKYHMFNILTKVVISAFKPFWPLQWVTFVLVNLALDALSLNINQFNLFSHKYMSKILISINTF